MCLLLLGNWLQIQGLFHEDCRGLKHIYTIGRLHQKVIFHGYYREASKFLPYCDGLNFRCHDCIFLSNCSSYFLLLHILYHSREEDPLFYKLPLLVHILNLRLVLLLIFTVGGELWLDVLALRLRYSWTRESDCSCQLLSLSSSECWYYITSYNNVNGTYQNILWVNLITCVVITNSDKFCLQVKFSANNVFLVLWYYQLLWISLTRIHVRGNILPMFYND